MSLAVDTGIVSHRVFEHAVDFLGSDTAAVTTIDIPIGLPGPEPRRCDEEARHLLGPRASSVFPAPVRATLGVESYEGACAASAMICGKKLSQQSYAILAKIGEVDTLLRRTPTLVASVFEVHPELCFYFWNARQPMGHPIRSGFGFIERYALVQGEFGSAAKDIRQALPRRAASDDDILDALAALWTARRIRTGTARRLPTVEERDECGLPMQMLA